MVKARSPGPIYMLPPTVGYNKHDYSRYRNPQYTMSPRVYPPDTRKAAPGPQYQVRGMNEHGKTGIPAYSMSPRHKALTAFNVPGPGTYHPERGPRMKEPRPPAYTMQPRTVVPTQNIGPGPLAYTLPSMLGPKVPNKHAQGAYSMYGRHADRRLSETPGPASYYGINTNIYRHKQPHYTMAGRLGSPVPNAFSPGPAAYLPKKLCGEGGPKFTMAPKYNDAYSPYITKQDNVPCVDP